MKKAARIAMSSICVVSFLIMDAGSPSAEEPPYEVVIEPGLTPELSPSQIVPKLPGPFGSGRIAGTIQSVERVALVLGQNVPQVDPSLSAQETDVPVWVVICRGEFRFSGPGDVSGAFNRGVYLVHHQSGLVYEWGGLPDAGSPPVRGAGQ